MSTSFVVISSFKENCKAVLMADISMKIYLPELCKDIFAGLNGTNTEELLESLAECKKVMKDAHKELNKQLEKDHQVPLKDFDKYSPGKLISTIKAFISNVDFEKARFVGYFEKLIKDGAFNYTSSKGPVDAYFESLKAPAPESEVAQEEQDEEGGEESEPKAKVEKTPYEKAVAMVKSIKNLDLSIEEMAKIISMLKEC